MRVLSISHRMPGPQIDNHSLFNAPTLFDYDAIVIDAGGVVESLRAAARGDGEFLTHADRPVVNGAAIDGVAGLAALLQRRRDEVQHALERGATVVVYVSAPTHVSGISGFTGADTYFYLPAPDGMAWDASTIVSGEGPGAAVVDHDHPFVRVFETYERDLLYRAYFNERLPGFAKHARVFLRSAGGAPVGVEFAMFSGRVIFMPTAAHPGDDRFAADEGAAIVVAVEALLGVVSGEAPYWVSDLAVPGLAEREAAVAGAQAAAEGTQSALARATAAVQERAAIRDVVWAGGDAALLAVALVCAEAIGFEHGQTPEGAPVLLDGDTQLHVVAAASAKAVGMSAHYRLRQRLDRVIEERAIAPRGLVIANGQCGAPPDERKREIEDSLRVAAEATRYAVLPAHALFAAAVAALEGAPPETLAAVRRRILDTDGIVALGDLIPSLREPDAGAGEPAVPTL